MGESNEGHRIRLPRFNAMVLAFMVGLTGVAAVVALVLWALANVLAKVLATLLVAVQ
jgi:hypothetical protein